MFLARTRSVCPLVLAVGFGCLLSAPRRGRAEAPAAPASAAEINSGKHATIEVKDVERRFTKPEAPPASSREKEKGPRLRLEDLQVRAKMLRQLIDRQIKKMQALIAVTGEDDPQKPDFYFRAGELYVENQRFYFNEAHALDQKIFELPPAQRGALSAKQQDYLRQEQAWTLDAVKAYIAATRYPKYDRMDEVLFRLAALLTSVKKEDQART
jgi:hypothetical protein